MGADPKVDFCATGSDWMLSFSMLNAITRDTPYFISICLIFHSISFNAPVLSQVRKPRLTVVSDSPKVMG